MKFRYYQDDQDEYNKWKAREQRQEDWGEGFMWIFIITIYSLVVIGGILLYKYL